MNLPPAHIAFDRQKILEANSPGCTRGSLKHEAAKLGVEHRRSLVSSVSRSVQAAQGSSRRSYFDSPTARSGTPPPCLRSSASLARAARISACLSESFTSLFWSSKFTTRYSIWPTCQHYPTGSPAFFHTSSPHSRALRSLPFVLRQIARSCCKPRQSAPTLLVFLEFCIPQCPICEHGWPSLWLRASRAAFQ